MIRLGCTANQGLLLDKTELYRNFTIDMAVKLSVHIDNKILIETINEEIKRNDCLRMLVKKHFFKWENVFCEPYEIKEIKIVDATNKKEEEVQEIIDRLCDNLIILKKVSRPFEIYQISADNGDYILFRVLHLNMDAYATLLTLADIVKVYFAKLNNTPLTDNLTSTKEFIEKYNNDLEKINKKIKEDTKYFIDKNKAMGEPTFLGCEGGYGQGEKRFKVNIFRQQPVEYYNSVFDKEFVGKMNDYCKDNKTTIASLFLSAIELYYSAVNDNYKDVSLFYTSDFRAKLSEKTLPLTNSTSIFFRRLIDENLSLSEFVRECDNEYLQTMKHASAAISKIYSYLINLKILDLNGRYDQIVFSYIPVNFEGLPEDVKVEPYLPKTKMANDFIVYFIVVPNADGSFSTFCRYYTEYLQKDVIERLYKGVHEAIETCINNPDMKVSEMLKRLK